MDRGNFDKLNPLHVVFLIQNILIGAGLLSLPHTLSPAGYNGWWVTLVMGAAAQITLLPMIFLCKRYPEDSIFTINQKLLGKILGNIANLLIIAYSVVSVAGISESYIRLVQSVVITEHSNTVPLLFFFIVMVYITLGGIKSVARFCMLGFVFTGWMAYYLQWAFQKGDITHVFPLFNVSIGEVVEAVHASYLNVLGYELILVFYPYIIQKGRALKHASLGIWITIGFYLVTTFGGVVYFNTWQLENIRYPILNLFKAVELTFIERIENFTIALWVFLILSSATAYLWAARKGFDILFPASKNFHVYLAAVMAYILIKGPLPAEIQDKLFVEWTIFSGYCVVLWPILLLLVHFIRKPKVTNL